MKKQIVSAFKNSLMITSCFIIGFIGLANAQKTNEQLHYPKATKGKVLVILSSLQNIPLKDGKSYATGYYLNELMIPVMSMMNAGYEPVFANPKGNKVYPDEHSLSVSLFGGDSNLYSKAIKTRDNLAGFEKPLTFETVLKQGLQNYKGIFFPGGHAPMGDLIKDEKLGRILVYFHSKQKPIALICHAPIALLSTTKAPSTYYQALVDSDSTKFNKLTTGWVFKGYKMTIFSSNEENIAEQSQLNGQMLFYPDDALSNAGGVVKTAKEWNSNVVEDRELITGQNPFSDNELSTKFINKTRWV
jgi:putative intracellular protease/amidase